MFNKKGFELSLNAIITIILAVAFLSIAIFLINKWFINIEFEIPNQCDIYPPTANNPICISSEIELKLGKTGKLKTAFYNTGQNDLTSSDIPIIECSSDINGNTIDLRTSSIGNNLQVSEYKDYSISLEVSKETKKGSYPCKISLGEMSKQFTIIIN
jgi:hypothetical protein